MLVIISCSLLVASFFVEGFAIAFFLQIISTALFCGRQWGVLFKRKTIFTWEILGFVMTVLWRLIRKRMTWSFFLPLLILRLAFMAYVAWDMSHYQYVTERVTIEEEEESII